MLEKVKINWKSGLTVALVSIPLSVSLALASGTTPVAGILTAIWAGLIASIFGGSNFNIVGPTGALSGLLASYVLLHGYNSLPTLAVITGVFILIAYWLKLEKYLVFIPASAVRGFTLGVAFIIALNQFNFATGLVDLVKHEKFIDNLIESFKHLNSVSWITIAVFLIFLILLFVFVKLTPKLPGAIILAPIGIVLGFLTINNKLPFSLETLGSKFPDLSPVLFAWPQWQFERPMLIVGATVALIAILETMLSAKIADTMTKTKHDKRKEMLGLGLANVASGLAGGIPATAALARTSLNIKTGGNDKISATISSVAVAIISLVLLSYFKYIPMAVIAAILVFVAIRMVESDHFIRMYQVDKKSFWLAMLVAFITVYEDPIIGILAGTVIALLMFLDKISQGHFDLVTSSPDKQIVCMISDEQIKKIDQKNHTLVYSIKGQLAYINNQAHIARFETGINGYNNVVLRLRELHFMDLDGVDAFDEIIAIIKSRGGKVLITGANISISEMLKESRNFIELEKEKLIFEHTADALRFLGVDFGMIEREYK